jgi:hypothetical protein
MPLLSARCTPQPHSGSCAAQASPTGSQPSRLRACVNALLAGTICMERCRGRANCRAKSESVK